MDSLRNIITSSSLHPAGPDSGIDACCNSASCTSGCSQPHPVEGGGVSGGGSGGCCGHTSQSEATSAIHDLSADVNDLPDDSPRTEDEAVSDDDGTDADHIIHTIAMDHSGTAIDCLDDLHALQIHVDHSDDGGEHDGAPLDNNRLFHQRVQLRDRGRMASKEEKQRQNEEIVTGIVSSSVSSETGSWESVFPQRTPTAILTDDAAAAAVVETAMPPTVTSVEAVPLIRTKDVRLPDFQFSSRQSTSSAASACFIDASSLMDESEMQLMGPQLPEVGCCGPKPDEPADLCEPSEVVTPDLHSPNLSDEQKLLHRVGPEPDRNMVLVDYDIKDQFASGPSSLLAVRLDSADGVEPPALDTEHQASGGTSDPEYRHRQDLERKQGHFLFRNSIQHYSGSVHVTPVRQMYHHDRDDGQSDMSLPSVYSTGSGDLGPPASLDPIAMGHCCSFSEPESGFYPDTPHNSIVHVDIPLVPVHIAGQAPPMIHDNDRMRPGQVEGPATIYRPPFDSPSVRRKTETCPILSGGLQTEDLQDEQTFKVGSFKEKPLSASLNSWVVDMSDCRSPKSERRRLDSVSSITSVNSNNGFAHSLDTKRPSQGTGFFVNLSDCASSLPPNISSVAAIDGKRGLDEAAGTAEAEKKNIFSMFIDFGDKKPINRREPISFTSRLSMAMQRQHPESTANSSDTESDRGDPANKPAVVRRTPTAARRMDPRNRHSWNEPNKTVASSSSTDRRRAEYTSSLSMPNGDHSGNIMSILDKIPLISKTSSMSADSPQSPLDDLTTSCSKSMSVYSNNSGKSMTSAEEDIKPEAPAVRRRRQDVEINETFDKSSRSSLPEEMLSTDTSPITDTDDVTFQNELDVDPLLDSILEQDAAVDNIVQQRADPVSDSRDAQTMESLQAIIERQQMLLLETVAEEPAPPSASTSAFVKLSDMDKPALKFELHSGEGGLSKSVGAGASRIERLFGDNGRQHRSGRSSAHPMSRSTGTTISSFLIVSEMY